MFAKTFEKFSYTSVVIPTLLLLGISYYYTTLEITESLFESKFINGILIFGALALSCYSIDTVTRQLTIERTNRNAYHLLLYPLIIMCYPVESIDMRFIVSSAVIWAAWRNVRIFVEINNPERKNKRLLDASVLLSFSSLIIVENLIIFIYPLIVLITSNINRDFKYFIIIFMTPLIILPSGYVLLSFLSLDTYLFSSYFFGDQLQIFDEFKLFLPFNYIPIYVVFILYILSVILKFNRASGLQRRILDFVGILFFILTAYFFSMNQELTGSEFHYLSLILVYFISQIFVKKIKSLYVNFIFIVLIATLVTFNFFI